VSRSPGPTDGSIAALTLLEPPNFTETVAQETSPGLVNGVAPGTSHYASWSPNGERLGFVAPNDDGSALGLFEASFDGADTKAIMENAPLYFVWSPDSKRLLIHRQQTLLLRDEDGGTRDLRRSSFRYRVPAFSPDGAAIAYVSDIGDGEQLIVRDLADDGELALWDVGTEAAFAWSPADASTLAAARRARTFGANYEGVVLFDTQTGERRELYGGTVLAFYWSPDGTKLALATTSAGSGRLGWTVVDVASGDATVLASFSPSRDTLIHLQFFDQFAPSHLVWSADSRFIVFAGDLIEARDRQRAPNQAWVIDTTGETDPLAIADARLALFAPLGAP
jgi:TolB protein